MNSISFKERKINKERENNKEHIKEFLTCLMKAYTQMNFA